MPKYKRKPSVVEAVIITRPISIQIGEDSVQGKPGDYLITDTNGEQYPCSAEAFEKNYKPIKTSTDVKAYVRQTLRKLKRKIKGNM